jgi:CRP-like cAMP-binding protein
MSQQEQASIGNHLLGALSESDFALMRPHLEGADYELRQIVFRAGEPIEHVCFPQKGIISIVADIEQGRYEVGMAGWEGLAGVSVVLGVERTPHTAMVQVSGHGLRITAAKLQSAMQQSTSLRSLLLRYVHTFVVQVSQTAYTNAAYDIEARLARWILMSHDRVRGDEVPLTHEFMSTMLGTGRPGVTFAVQQLEGNGLIRALRGRIIIRNREALEELAANGYGMAEREYSNVLQFPIKGNR